MRTKVKTNVIISDDADGKNVLFGFDDALSEEVIDVYTRCVSGRFSVAAGGAVEETLPFGDIDNVQGVYVKADAGFVFRVNGGVEEITTVAASTSGSSKVLLQAALSSMIIKNTSVSSVLNGVWVAWGDITS